MFRKAVWVGAVGILGTAVACSDAPPTAVRGAPAARRPSIADGANGGNEHFYFLAPLVPTPAFSGTFDSTSVPTVEVCELAGGSCGRIVARFTRDAGTGSELVRVVPADEHYIVNWQTDRHALDTTKTYRIQVLVRGGEAGHADVDVVSTGRELKNVATGQYIGLVNGRTLPIKFRIEQGLVISQPGVVTGVMTPGDVTVHVNRADPVLLTRPDRDGEVLQVQGERGADGRVTRVTGFSKFAFGSPALRDYVKVGDNNLPSEVHLRDGSRVRYTWLSATRVSIEVTLPDGRSAVAIADQSELGATSLQAPSGALRQEDAARPSPSGAIDSTTLLRNAEAAWAARIRQAAGVTLDVAPAGAATVAAAGQNSVIRAKVDAGDAILGQPLSGAFVSSSYTVRRQDGTVLAASAITLPESGEKGVYLQALPTLPAPSDAIDDARGICNDVTTRYGAYCDAFGVWEAVLTGVACAKFTGVPGIGGLLAAACVRATAASGALCAFEAACSGFQRLYDAGLIAAEAQLAVTTTVRPPGTGRGVAPQHKQWSSPYPELLPFDFLVPFDVRLTTDPADPGPRQGYTATFEVYPVVNPGWEVTMFVQGTDQYYDSIVRPTDANGRVTLYVPGGAAGVQDHVVGAGYGQRVDVWLTF